MARIQISNDPSGRIIVSFPYDPLLVAKVKTIDGRRWHPAEKHWSFRNNPSPPYRWGRSVRLATEVRVGVQKLELGLPEALYSCKQERLDEDKKPIRSDFTEGRMWKPIGMNKRHCHLSLKF